MPNPDKVIAETAADLFSFSLNSDDASVPMDLDEDDAQADQSQASDQSVPEFMESPPLEALEPGNENEDVINNILSRILDNKFESAYTLYAKYCLRPRSMSGGLLPFFNENNMLAVQHPSIPAQLSALQAYCFLLPDTHPQRLQALLALQECKHFPFRAYIANTYPIQAVLLELQYAHLSRYHDGHYTQFLYLFKLQLGVLEKKNALADIINLYQTTLVTLQGNVDKNRQHLAYLYQDLGDLHAKQYTPSLESQQDDHYSTAIEAFDNALNLCKNTPKLDILQMDILRKKSMLYAEDAYESVDEEELTQEVLQVCELLSSNLNADFFRVFRDYMMSFVTDTMVDRKQKPLVSRLLTTVLTQDALLEKIPEFHQTLLRERDLLQQEEECYQANRYRL
ncbi:MAG: hypothetical protein DHS20C10_11980 [marine bacterium B5-7]|nr:MAG: hypothetical protein DHS20C10_11980 [marine bacterium B5-7]